MKRLEAFKFELHPNDAQRQQMRRCAGSCRFVYNKGLALQRARFEAGEKKLSYVGLCKLLTEWRNSPETPMPRVNRELEMVQAMLEMRPAESRG